MIAASIIMVVLDAIDPPLWWSWLSWPTTFLTAALCSCLYLLLASRGLDTVRRAATVVGGAIAAAGIACIVYSGASNICADGASIRVEPWVLPASGALWLGALSGLSVIASVPPGRSWVAPLVIVAAAFPALLVESLFTLHTLSRQCDGIGTALRVHTAISLLVPGLVLALGGGVIWLSFRRRAS